MGCVSHARDFLSFKNFSTFSYIMFLHLLYALKTVSKDWELHSELLLHRSVLNH